MVLFQRFTIWRKIKFKAVIFVLILVGLFTGGLFFSRDKEPVEWGPLTVLEINSGDSCTFVDPQEGYYHVTLDRNKLVFPEIINHQACDCKIDDDKILVAYINTKSPSELIFKVITKGNSQRRIILETLSNQRIEEGAYPKIYITEGAYYVLSGRCLYKLSKADLKIEKIQLESSETPLITRDGRLFFRQGDFLTLDENYGDKKMLQLSSKERVSGWGIEGESVIIERKDMAKMVSLKDETRTKLRTPSYGSLNVVGNMGHIDIILFSHASGEVPLFDPALAAYSIIDHIDYWYYSPYLYDAVQHKFYDIPDEVKQLLPSHDASLTGYCAPLNLKLIEAEFHQYMDN
ncbi:hypothetical protein I3700191H1_17710 [Megasphaera massiliensis]|uniref:hypothetical protein n=1 Tax=Megasphaera massiliensis TaxID=1232428 RepID=UPI0034AAFE58